MKRQMLYITAVLMLFLSSCEKEQQTAPETARWNKVYEYIPGPGQFINMGMTEKVKTPAEAVAAAEKILANEGYSLSLGGFGGFVVVGFDHDVINDGGYNIAIEGMSSEKSSEPGVVYVMKDENRNGQPDDNWYELKGSEYGKGNDIRGYSITWFRPESAGMNVSWKDNQGNEGQISNVPSIHPQKGCWPDWIRQDSYTLSGTCLNGKNIKSDGRWDKGSFEWGYADNFNDKDMLGTWRSNHFRICDAVNEDGTPAELDHINFVKIQTGINAGSKTTGEISTDIMNIHDYNLMK